ncbi:MAG: BTAD domain-containing putative transcriptional regulator, partial [Chloroflexota bacterium]
MALLWPEMPRKSAQDNLRQTLYQLRRTIPEVSGQDGDSIPFILSDRQQVQINPDAPYRLDVADFTALVDDGSLEQLAAAVGLYRGDFLTDFYLEDSNQFESWAAEWRGRLRRQALEALDRLAAHHLEQGRPDQAADYARRMLTIDNLRESGHRQLMEALSQVGKRAEALRQYKRCRSLLEEQLGVAPSAETEAVAAAIRRGGRAGGQARRLPAPETPIIGREKELVDIVGLFADGARLVSIVGPGGIGKTRLALEIAHRFAAGSDEIQLDEVTYGIRAAFIDLAPISGPIDLVPVMAQGLDMSFEKGDRDELKRRLLDYLSRKELLLILDNFEHLLGGAPLLKEIIKAAPGVKLLITSRERLRLRAEHVYPLAGLGYSTWTTPVQASRDPAVQLFLHHARRVRPAFSLRSEHLAPLGEILRMTEGMPLALILAAGWVRALDLATIAVKLGQSLGFLKATHRDVPDRQRSMQAVFAATWGRLSDRERALFAEMSLFRGSFTRAAAEAVTGATAGDLIQLVDHSLLTRLGGGRFVIHELLRQFARKQLEEFGREDAVRAAHSHYYLKTLVDLLPELKTAGQLETVDRIAANFENIRVGWRWACQVGQWTNLSIASESIHLFAIVRSRFVDVIELLETAQRSLAPVSNGEASSWAYITASWLALSVEAGSLEEVSGVASQLQITAENLADKRVAAYCQLALGEMLRVSDHNKEAIEQLEAALAYYEEEQDSFYIALTLWRLGWAKYRSGQGEEGINLQHRGLTIARRTKNPYITAGLLRSIGAMTWLLEGLTEMVETYQLEAADLQLEMGTRVEYAYNLSQLATMPIWRDGDLRHVHSMLNEAQAIAEEQNVPHLKAHVLAEMITVQLVEGRYQEALTMTEEVMVMAHQGLSTWIWAAFQRGIAYLGLGRIEEAIEAIKLPLSRMIEEDWSGLLRTLI